MRPYLDAWLDAPDVAPAIHFGEFLVANAMQAAAGMPLTNPWLRERHDQDTQVRHWLVGVTARFVPRLEAAFLDTSDEQTLDGSLM